MTFQDRRERIVTLLDHWQDFFDVGGSANGGAGDGAGPVLSSMASHPSVVELTRCLEVCRRMAPGHYKHLIGFYGAEWRTARAIEMRRVGKNFVPRIDAVTGRPLLDPDPKKMRRERVVPAWVTSRMVERAVDFLCGVFRGDPELPLALTKKLRALADSDGWTEAA